MVHKFNEYFVNVGIELANKIAPPNQHVSVHDYLITKNKSSIFLDPVLEQDIIATVNSCKSKTSCDFNGIDMKVVIKSYIVYRPTFIRYLQQIIYTRCIPRQHESRYSQCLS